MVAIGGKNMSRKPKFKPEITRVKLNPEQAVLNCNCWDTGYQNYIGGSGSGAQTVCTEIRGNKAYGDPLNSNTGDTSS